jgi:hypothetical protein
MKPSEVQAALTQFQTEVATLKGTALLDKKNAFDNLPEAKDGGQDLRLHQSLVLESALIQEFGTDQWQKALADRINDKPGA